MSGFVKLWRNFENLLADWKKIAKQKPSKSQKKELTDKPKYNKFLGQ